MNNFQLPAYPIINQEGTSSEDRAVFYGFTKLELASLMISQGFISGGFNPIDSITFPAECVRIAKGVIEEANK